ncbi:MAG: hypothetical protein ABII26_11410 [Pseudomonadota bacterium]
MEINEAIMAFSQSEKIKAGLIWASQTLNLLQGLADMEKKGAEKIIHAVLNMIGHEVRLAKTVVGNEWWDEIETCIERALIMVNSGVGEEAVVHLSKALSKTTNVGQQSMSFLKEKGLL